MNAISEFDRALLVSVRPYYASKIVAGEKTIELRRRFPESRTAGAVVLIYSSSPVRAVVCCARIKQVLKLPLSTIWKEYGAAACISKTDLYAYFAGLKDGFAIVFESAWRPKRQMEAIDLRGQFGIVPPQSYRYVSCDVVAFLNNEQFQPPDRYQRPDWPRRCSAGPSVAR